MQNMNSFELNCARSTLYNDTQAANILFCKLLHMYNFPVVILKHLTVISVKVINTDCIIGPKYLFIWCIGGPLTALCAPLQADKHKNPEHKFKT